MPPETRYARSGDVNIAYQVVGEGPRDLVYVPGGVSNIEMMWEQPPTARFLERLASFSRLILFNKRGTGLSDRVSNDELPTLERRMDDVRAVLETVGSERAARFRHSEGGNMCMLHTGTRIAALAGPGEVLVSQTVKDLVSGSGLVFEDRGIHGLKGVPGEWRVYAAV